MLERGERREERGGRRCVAAVVVVDGVVVVGSGGVRCVVSCCAVVWRGVVWVLVWWRFVVLWPGLAWRDVVPCGATWCCLVFLFGLEGSGALGVDHSRKNSEQEREQEQEQEKEGSMCKITIKGMNNTRGVGQYPNHAQV